LTFAGQACRELDIALTDEAAASSDTGGMFAVEAA
jgi:hypothetical protein